MHIVFFGDQHLESLGGAQVSMRLQRRYLERAGHIVTAVAPKMHASLPSTLQRAQGAKDSDTSRPLSRAHASRRLGAVRSTGRSGAWGSKGAADPAYLDLPSIPITLDREYSMSWPGARTDRFIDRGMKNRPPVDLVHVQADFWGAFIGHRFAHRHGIPVVHTMHNRVDVGMAAVTPLHRPVLAILNLWRRAAMRGIGNPTGGTDGWAFLRGIAEGSSAVTAPSGHFARRLEQHGVFDPVDVVWNGIDDELLAAILAARAVDEIPDVSRQRRPRFVWLGRMSPEKRLLPFLEAVVASKVDADIEVIGGGGQQRAAEKIARGHAGVTFAGRLSYAETLARIAAADAVVQTSIGFETQGMTPFEAATLGTPTIVSDPDIAGELRGGLWTVPDASVTALAQTLQLAASDIVAGRAPVPVPEVAAEFLQSSRTAAMIEIYRRVLSEQ